MRRCLIAVLPVLMCACGPVKDPLESGCYLRVFTPPGEEEMRSDPNVSICLELERNEAKLTTAGQVRRLPLTRVRVSDWVEACPTMHGVDLLEWAWLNGPMTIAGITLEVPIIQAACHHEGWWLVDGRMIPFNSSLTLGEEAWLVHDAIEDPDRDSQTISFVPRELLL